MSETNPRWGTTLDAFLEEEGILEATKAEALTRVVGFASYGAMKARTLAIARGELQPEAEEPRLWFTSEESFVDFCKKAR